MARHTAILGSVNELLAREEYERAEGVLKRALAGGPPRDAGLLHSMGYVLVRMQRFVQAEYFMRRAVELTPKSPAALHNLASLLVTLGKFEDAAGVMGRVLEVDPRDSWGQGRVGEDLVEAKPVPRRRARRVLEEGLNGSVPRTRSSWSRRWAHTLHQHGRAEEAVGLMRRAAGIEPRQSKYLDLLCSMLTYAPGVEAREVFEAHVEYGKQLEREVGARERPARAGGVWGDNVSGRCEGWGCFGGICGGLRWRLFLSRCWGGWIGVGWRCIVITLGRRRTARVGRGLKGIGGGVAARGGAVGAGGGRGDRGGWDRRAD